MNELGAIKVAPDVLHTIAQVTARGTKGVADLYGQHPVKIRMAAEGVSLDLHVVVSEGSNMLQVGQQLQLELKRAITDMAGLPIQEINVHIQDVLLSERR